MINYHNWMTKDAQTVEQMRKQNEAQAADWYRIYRTLGSAIGTIFSKLLSRNRKKAAIRELRALDDRMLSDLGISRSEILRVVDGLDRNDQRQPADVYQPPKTSERDSIIETKATQRPNRSPRRLSNQVEFTPPLMVPLGAAGPTTTPPPTAEVQMIVGEPRSDCRCHADLGQPV